MIIVMIHIFDDTTIWRINIYCLYLHWLFTGIWFQSPCRFDGKDCWIGNCGERKDEGRIHFFEILYIWFLYLIFIFDTSADSWNISYFQSWYSSSILLIQEITIWHYFSRIKLTRFWNMDVTFSSTDNWFTIIRNNYLPTPVLWPLSTLTLTVSRD